MLYTLDDRFSIAAHIINQENKRVPGRLCRIKQRERTKKNNPTQKYNMFRIFAPADRILGIEREISRQQLVVINENVQQEIDS